MLKLTIWMNYPSPYQDDLFAELAMNRDVDLTVVFAGKVTPDRLKLGWQTNKKNYQYRILGGSARLVSALYLAWQQRDRLHIVGGIWADPAFAAVLCLLRISGGKYVVYSEAPGANIMWPGKKSFVKRKFGQWIAHEATGALAISHFATEFFTQLKFNPERICQFGYFRAGFAGTEHRIEDGKLKDLLFIGQIIPRKGIDLLLEALIPILSEWPDVKLSIVGDGSLRPELERLVREKELTHRIRFEGVLPSDQIQVRLQEAELLILPSRWDGWGVVVNEAFSKGVPVVVSDHCGAADLVCHEINGYVFRNEDVEELRSCLVHYFHRPEQRQQMRQAARRLGNLIDTKIVAPYLIECLSYLQSHSVKCPIPPWLLPITNQAMRQSLAGVEK